MARLYISPCASLHVTFVCSATHERVGFVIPEQRLYLVVLLQLRVHDDGVDTSLDAVLVQIFKQQQRNSTLLILRHYTHNECLQCVVFLQRLHDADEPEGEQSSV